MSDGALSQKEINDIISATEGKQIFKYVHPKKELNVDITFESLKKDNYELALELRSVFTDVLHFMHFLQKDIENLQKENKDLRRLLGAQDLLD